MATLLKAMCPRYEGKLKLAAEFFEDTGMRPRAG